MATVRDWRGLGASKGVALSTTKAITSFIPGQSVISMTPRNFAGAAVARYTFCPWVKVLKTTDDLVAPANLTDYSDEAQDSDTGTSVVASSLGTIAQGDYLLVGAEVPFRGLNVDVDGTNGDAATMSVNYWNGSAWANITPTDGTETGGASLAQDGDVTWTVPAAWASGRLNDIATAPDSNMRNLGIAGLDLYWVQIGFSAALDASVTLDHVLALNESTTYSEMEAGQTLEQAVHRGLGGQSAIEALTDAGTANLVIRAGTFGRFA